MLQASAVMAVCIPQLLHECIFICVTKCLRVAQVFGGIVSRSVSFICRIVNIVLMWYMYSVRTTMYIPLHFSVVLCAFCVYRTVCVYMQI